MKLNYFFISSIAFVALAACNDDKADNKNTTTSANTHEVAKELTATEVTQAFFDNVVKGDIDGAVDLVYIPADQQNSEQYLAKVNSEVTKGHQYLGSDESKVLEIKAGKADITAIVPVTMTDKDGDAQTKKFDLIKTAKGWKIDMRNAF